MGLITTQQAAEYLGIRPEALHQRAHRARIKPHKLGSMLWWSENELAQLKEKKKPGPKRKEGLTE